jgi:hypothetical protein
VKESAELSILLELRHIGTVLVDVLIDWKASPFPTNNNPMVVERQASDFIVKRYVLALQLFR